MEKFPQLFKLIPDDKEWLVSHRVSEEKKLELRLGPPGEFLAYNNNSNNHAAKRVFGDTVETKPGEENWLTDSSHDKQCLKLSCFQKTVEKVISTPNSAFQTEPQKEILQTKCSFPQPCVSRVAEVQCPDKRACLTSANASVSKNEAVTNNSNKRIALAPVVGWPPIRSFRKNLASSSLSKPASEPLNKTTKEATGGKSESFNNHLFVKINMEGVPIGRKVNVSAHSSYEELSIAINELFKGLLAAQRDSPATEKENKMEEAKAITDSFGRSGEYTLVYEDNEGDRMLVGDVPWHMFVSTVKRLRVLKSSDLSTLPLGSGEQEKSTRLDSAVEIGK